NRTRLVSVWVSVLLEWRLPRCVTAHAGVLRFSPTESLRDGLCGWLVSAVPSTTSSRLWLIFLTLCGAACVCSALVVCAVPSVTPPHSSRSASGCSGNTNRTRLVSVWVSVLLEWRLPRCVTAHAGVLHFSPTESHGQLRVGLWCWLVSAAPSTTSWCLWL